MSTVEPRETKDLAEALTALSELDGQTVAAVVTQRSSPDGERSIVARGRLGVLDIEPAKRGGHVTIPIEHLDATETWGQPGVDFEAADFEYAELFGMGRVAFAVGALRIMVARSTD